MGIVLFVPFRHGTQWARWAIPAIGYALYAPVLIATLSVTLNTPATPPWKLIVLGMVVLIIGLILSLESGQKTEMIVDRSVA